MTGETILMKRMRYVVKSGWKRVVKDRAARVYKG